MSMRNFIVVIAGIVVVSLVVFRGMFLWQALQELNYRYEALSLNTERLEESSVRTKEDIFGISRKAREIDYVRTISRNANAHSRKVAIRTLNLKKNVNDYHFYYPDIAVIKKVDMFDETIVFRDFIVSENMRNLVVLGNDTIDGKECVVFEYSSPDFDYLLEEMPLSGEIKRRTWLLKEHGLVIRNIFFFEPVGVFPIDKIFLAIFNKEEERFLLEKQEKRVKFDNILTKISKDIYVVVDDKEN